MIMRCRWFSMVFVLWFWFGVAVSLVALSGLAGVLTSVTDFSGFAWERSVESGLRPLRGGLYSRCSWTLRCPPLRVTIPVVFGHSGDLRAPLAAFAHGSESRGGRPPPASSPLLLRTVGHSLTATRPGGLWPWRCAPALQRSLSTPLFVREW